VRTPHPIDALAGSPSVLLVAWLLVDTSYRLFLLRRGSRLWSAYTSHLA